MNGQEYLRQRLSNSSIYVNCCNCRHNTDHIGQDRTCLSCVNRSRFEPTRLAEAEVTLILEDYERRRLCREVCQRADSSDDQ